MNEVDLCKAIKLLKPSSEFVLSETDYASIIWHKLDGDAPIWTEIEAAHQTIKAAEAEAEAETATKRATAEAKLAALGLTADDLKALGL